MFVIALSISAITGLIGYVIHLIFGWLVLRETGDATALKQAAEYTRGYCSANIRAVMDGLAKWRKPT